MTVVELKEKLIAQINSIDDEMLLDSIARNLEFELEINNEPYILSQGEIDAVNEGLEQFKNGQWITNEESNRRVDEWLKKYDGQ
ncbi:hypothetical protein FO440_05320 [Mucilaginibacter corticis]|uniref:Uncharacterized protein n=1 Tax=Mucilaginibacter corticis TaxID=2597670 RepID=A0A556MUS3_9SPHI|nr:hypothetical protein [Mucilaginibacter corticis]TSJ43613.1 hypothetical protein FO440_05320 [Mucilaginibacter corticis]